MAEMPQHNKKPTDVVVAPPRCSCWWQPLLTTAAIGAVVGIPVWASTKEDRKEPDKKVELQPRNDGMLLVLKINH